MNSNSALIAIALAAVLAIAIVPISLQRAFAHAHTDLDVPASEHLMSKKVTFVLGHTAEPTFGVEPGVHDGIHNMEILLSDTATKLPLTGAILKVDKYYFKNIESFNKARSVNDANEIAKNVTVGTVFGDPGHYMVRQVQADGIYGYHVYGTIDYFKVAQIPIDTTVFCKASDGDTSKFNSPGWSGGFGCTEDINNIAFPKDAISSKNNDNNGQGNEHKTLKISAVDANGQALHMYAKVKQNGQILKDGFTPLTFEGVAGQTYQIGVANFSDKQFAHWEDGSTMQRERTVTLSGDAMFTAKYSTITAKTSSSDVAQTTIPVPYGYAANTPADAVASVGVTKSSDNAGISQLFGIGIPIAAAAGVIGWRKLKRSED